MSWESCRISKKAVELSHGSMITARLQHLGGRGFSMQSCPAAWLHAGLCYHRHAACTGAVAHGVYVDSSHTTANFGKLRLVTSADHTDLQQLQAAGWLEGYLTAGTVLLRLSCSHS